MEEKQMTEEEMKKHLEGVDSLVKSVLEDKQEPMFEGGELTKEEDGLMKKVGIVLILIMIFIFTIIIFLAGRMTC